MATLSERLRHVLKEMRREGEAVPYDDDLTEIHNDLEKLETALADAVKLLKRIADGTMTSSGDLVGARWEELAIVAAVRKHLATTGGGE
jgi:hypothetical protein